MDTVKDASIEPQRNFICIIEQVFFLILVFSLGTIRNFRHIYERFAKSKKPELFLDF